MPCVLALFPRHVQLRGRRIGASARVRRIRDVHAWPEARRPIQHLRAIPRYPVGNAALPPPGRPRGGGRHRAGRSSRKPADTERIAQRLSHQCRELLSLRRRALQRRHASPAEPRASSTSSFSRRPAAESTANAPDQDGRTFDAAFNPASTLPSCALRRAAEAHTTSRSSFARSPTRRHSSAEAERSRFLRARQRASRFM